MVTNLVCTYFTQDYKTTICLYVKLTFLHVLTVEIGNSVLFYVADIFLIYSEEFISLISFLSQNKTDPLSLHSRFCSHERFS